MQSFRQRLQNRYSVSRIIASFIALVCFFSLYRYTIFRLGAFGCFDDCFNIVGGYFLGTGRKVFSELFFNHQPLAAYISLLIQHLTSPDTIYELIRRHREFIFLWAFCWNIFFIWRFGSHFVFFTIVYEITKPFVFGERFLAEGIVLYPFVYICTLLFELIHDTVISFVESCTVILVLIFTFWLREPFVILTGFFTALFLFLVRRRTYFPIILSLLIIGFLISFTGISFKDYWEQVVYVNAHVHNVSDALSVQNIAQAFYYPILVYRATSIFGLLEKIMVTTFGITAIVYYRKKRSLFSFIFFFISLGLSNFRYTDPGQMYYSSFHMIVWWAFLISMTSAYIAKLNSSRVIICVACISCFGIVLSVIFHPTSYIQEKVDRYSEFSTNYGSDFVYGEIIRILKKPGDTLFIDGANELVYWQSRLGSTYQYAWYTSVMPRFEKYSQLRHEFLLNNPPVFYMTFCQNRKDDSKIPRELEAKYTNILFSGTPSCLYMRISSQEGVTDGQKNEIKRYGYTF